MAEYGDRVRMKVGATGRYVGYGLALAVSAQDNDLFIAEAVDSPPHPTVPVPSDDMLAGAVEALRYAKWQARHTAPTTDPTGSPNA